MRNHGTPIGRAALLTSVSALALMVYLERGVDAADLADPLAPVAPAVVDAGEVWLSIEGAINRFEGDELGQRPSYSEGPWGTYTYNLPKALVGENGWGGSIEVGGRPGGSAFDFVGRLRYRQGDGNTGSSYYSELGWWGYSESRKVEETQIIGDFEVGRNIGIGLGNRAQTRVHAGLRFTHFDSKANGSFDEFWDSGWAYESISLRQHSTFTGIGPRIGIESDIPLGNTNFMAELGVAGALLFGRRETDSDYESSEYSSWWGWGPYSYSDQTSQNEHVIVPNLEASAALTYLFNENFSTSLGYRFDGYWNIVETDGLEGSRDGDRFMHEFFLRGTVRLHGR